MTTPIAVAAISRYQHLISPRKGWACAYRVHRGGLSCSEWIKRAIARRGVRVGALLARRRFARCKAAHEEHKAKQRKAKRDYNSCDVSSLPFDCCCYAPQIGEALGTVECASCACIPFV
ncbi:MAG TPA: membrane protein insertion efficiency factor YidD [Abditibacteriaceae bacterium]|jgi:putative component of membrane protein insertase Oxa1/YidC/SpoIIIJ protein YidD